METDWLDLPFTGPFDLAASARFIEGFTPSQSFVDQEGRLRLAFPASPSWEPVAALVRQAAPNGPVQVRLNAAPEDVPAVLSHVQRILSLDVDGSGFADLASHDPVIREVQALAPGLRPVLFHSPYEAACWSIISQRVRTTQAAALKNQIARRVGTKVAVPAGRNELPGIQLDTFPAPRRLLSLDRIPLLPEVKSTRLRATAEAALAGDLDAAKLRAMPADEALRHLATLPGIGPFSAQLILLRGAGHPDVFATAEPRLHQAITAAYGLRRPSVNDLAQVADGWRPYRTWVSVLFRAQGDLARL
ncbi:DNA-3-methyladenine glycosylase 2 family protein [Kibdelosporangium philippinense]|uniref:DNA-3-methyladenine glycosylase II n=1 Tax=Kibdelosporangium philippinense TaxID=211113 RepID=A0ABS8Z9X3_9PSEU|nr:DNA-3-methyladenine glycosylase 2 family protein [Kibdelosporangium philippinense]MCE7003333.1 DNA-3-methyladenine glycosylase 2 family protein [Kibdelosporangium philippinense]